MQDIRGYEGLYAVTEDGRIWSYKTNRYMTTRSRKGDGYVVVDLRNSEQQKATLYVHHLVANAYCNRVDSKLEVNHIDGDKLNNNANNLELVTRSENIQHSYDIGIRKVHENTIKAIKATCKKRRIVPEQVVRQIRSLYASDYSLTEIARMVGYSLGSVSKIAYGQTYKEVA